MDCQEIKNIIPRYFQHTASEEEVKAVEEHLCVCHECRLALGELMDKMEEAGKPVEPQNPEEDIHIIPESGGESLEDVASASEKEEPAPAAEPEKEEKPEEQQEEVKASPESQEQEQPQAPEPQKQEPLAEEKPEEQPAPDKEDIEYFAGRDIEDISEEKEKAASGEDASIEEEIKPFFEEKSEAEQSAPAPEPEPPATEPVRDLDAETSEGGIEEEELKPQEEQVQQEPASDFPEKFSLEGESKVGLFEYGSLAIGLGILGFFVYLLLKG